MLRDYVTLYEFRNDLGLLSYFREILDTPVKFLHLSLPEQLFKNFHALRPWLLPWGREAVSFSFLYPRFENGLSIVPFEFS